MENVQFRYSGYVYDSETGLYYLNARYYDSKIARFLSEDTYGGDANDPLSLNLYTYCHNEPIMYTDPTGHWESCDSNLSSDDQKRMEQLTQDYNAAKKSGNLQAAEDAHRAAVAIRESSGKVSNYVDNYNYHTQESYGNSSSSYSEGSSGTNVAAIQTALNSNGYNLGKYGADGDFGTYTKGAVVRYQIDNELYYDGIVGKNTSKSLGVVFKKSTSSVDSTAVQTSVTPSKYNGAPPAGYYANQGTSFNAKVNSIDRSTYNKIMNLINRDKLKADAAINWDLEGQVYGFKQAALDIPNMFIDAHNKGVPSWQQQLKIPRLEADHKEPYLLNNQRTFDTGASEGELLFEGTSFYAGLGVGEAINAYKVSKIAKVASVAEETASSQVATQASNSKIQNIVGQVKDYLGTGAKAELNETGDLVIQSENGLKKVRFDLNNTSPHTSPHGHVEEFTPFKNKLNPTYKSGPIYPNDVPNK